MAWIGQVPFEDIGMTEDKMALLAELAEDNKYWKRAHSFIRSIAGSVLSSLSYNQRQWLTTIVLGLDDELNKRSWNV